MQDFATGKAVFSKALLQLTCFFEKNRNAVRIMKLTGILLMAACLQLSAKGLTQTVTISVKNAPLISVLNEIKKQTGFTFFADSKELQKAKKVSISAKGLPLTLVLDLCFRDQPLTYSIIDRVINIVPKEDKTKVESSTSFVPVVDVRGKVVNEKEEAVSNVTVTIKGTNISTSTDANGEFTLNSVDRDAVLVFSHISMETFEVKVSGRTELAISLKTKISELGGIVVTVNTGYQQLPKERATGSFDFVDNKLFNRSVSTNFLDRIENVTPGVLFDKNKNAPDALLVRGRSTIFANANPLIVLDNFPYDGDLSNINPNDIENITILKDAAAASIWGARAGNGVIVVTTKKGKTAKPQVSLNSNVSIQNRPDIYNVSQISSSDFIELEKYLYNQNYYKSTFSDPGNPPITPVVEILDAVANGTISSADADVQIENIKQNDVREDLDKHFYRKSVNQQYNLNISGSTPFVNYYFSTGWDRNLSNVVGRHSDRITIRSLNTFKISKKLQADVGVNYVQSLNRSGNNPGFEFNSVVSGKSFYPYARLTDDYGNAVPLFIDYRKQFVDKAISNGLLDWKYNPIADINNEKNSVKIIDYLINAGLQYKIIDQLTIDLKYQYENSLTNGNDFYNENSYYVRNLVNNYYQPNGANKYPIPIGGIVNINNSEIVSHQGRAQISYNKIISHNHHIAAIAGWEIRNLVRTGKTNRYYGYDQDRSSVYQDIDFTTQFQLYSNPLRQSKIPNFQSVSKTVDNFLSFFANASYTFKDRYTLSASGREDEANLFGVKTNQKGTPLYSIGGSWQISKEDFYKFTLLPFLKLRITYGRNGNISRLASAYSTIVFSSSSSSTPLTNAAIQNPPNEKLRWEQVNTLNLGIDFALKHNILFGTAEFFVKKSNDLIGQSLVDPTLGLSNILGQSFYFGNVASMKGRGVDIQLNSKIFDRKFKWDANFLFSFSSSTVTKYLATPSSSGNIYLSPGYGVNPYSINPVIGRPVFSMYSYQWAGLDPNTGDPLSIMDHTTTNNYSSIMNLPLDSMIFHGAVQPKYYGALRNTFSFKNISVSFNISYKFGYYFRKPSINYTNLVSNWTGSGDYAKRWQQPGDEKHTDVPSFIYPMNFQRDQFYQYSSINVLKGDHIRLEDITLNYDFNVKQIPKVFKAVRVYVYASNLGVLWTRNKDKIDPYYINAPTPGKNISGGLNILF